MADAEFSLVEKVELRIALADTDEKFEKSLQLYLSPLVLKFASPHSKVRSQIAKITKYLLTRINSSLNVQLPVDSLLSQVKDPKVPAGADPSTVQSYSLLFISKGIGRLPESKQRQLIPQVIQGISTVKPAIAARLFNILCKLILSWQTPDRATVKPEEIRQLLQLEQNKEDEHFLIDKFAKFMLLHPVQPNDAGAIPRAFSLPGLSTEDCAFFTYNAGVTFDGPTLLNYKQKILRFVEYGWHPNHLLIMIIGSVDSTSSISELASSMLKRDTIDYEDAYIVDTLIDLFLGDLSISRPPAKAQLQEKLMNYCSQSKRAAVSPQVGKLSSVGLNSEYGKLKQATIKFIKWITTLNAATDQSSTDSVELNVTIAAQLRSNLQSDSGSGDSSVNTNYQAIITQRQYQYEALGLILRKAPKLEDLSYIEFLFDALSTDLVELRTTILEALSGLTVHLQKLSDRQKLGLMNFLKDIIISSSLNTNKSIYVTDNKERVGSIRYMAVKFVNHAFSFDNAEARLLCIYCLSQNDNPSTIEEATKGLNPYWFNILQTADSEQLNGKTAHVQALKFPSFDKLVTRLNITKVNPETSNNINFIKAIEFAFQCLVMQAIGDKTTVVTLDQEWSVRLQKSLEFDDTVNDLFAKELERLSMESGNIDLDGDETMAADFDQGFNSLELFINLIINESITASVKPNVDVFSLLIKILSMSTAESIDKFVDTIDSFKVLLTNPSYMSSEETHYAIAKILSLLCSCPSTSGSKIINLIEYLIKIEDPLSLGYVLSRVVLNESKRSNISEELFEKIIGEILTRLNSSSTLKQRLAIDALSELFLYGAFGPTLKLSSKVDEYRLAFKEKLDPLVKKGDEKATIGWAYLGLSTDSSLEGDSNEEDDLSPFEELILDNYNNKQIDYFFSSGEALSVLASGWDSKFLKRKIEIVNKSHELLIPTDANHTRLNIILKKVLKLSKDSKPALRKACCLWLLSLTQYCGHLLPIKEHSQEIHVAFMRFLTERDDIVQESASRGLSMIYEMGDYELKDTLVHNLLLSFTDTNKTKALSSGMMNNDTTLFESGVLNTGDGSVSTYKDILSLASEVGDPGLVYKFMSLAQHSALWSSRKGIAFGLGAVLAKSKLDELLTKDKNLSLRLIPKLYRYRFDPSKSVSDSMNEIWNTLISDSSSVISTHFDIILKDLLTSMGTREWRVRQASTAALQDLLSHQPLEQYEDKLEQIWTMSFRVMDDIKDSVRKEGNLLTRYLASTMVKSISTETGSIKTSQRANRVLEQLIPFLLGNNGLLNESEDVRSFAFSTIMKLCKSSSHSLKPFIGDMVEQMIVLMSTIEPQIINYLTLNADKYNLKAEDIDSHRLQSVGTSPMMEAVEKLLNLLDDNLMEDFITHLSSAIKKSVGLPSKVAGSKVIVTLVVRHIFIAKDYGDKLLKISSSQMKDKNETIAASYATACGYCCRIASVKQISKFAEKIEKYYFDSGINNNSGANSKDEKLKFISAVATESVFKYSGDKFDSMAAAFLPLSFIAKNDSNEKVSKTFERAWSDSTGGAGAIKLYLSEIIELVKKHIGSQNFEVRQACAKSIVEATNKLGGGSNLGNKDTTTDLFKVLLEACVGRSWKGKENILDSLVSLSLKSEQFLADSELLEKISKTVLVEAKRKNKEYQKHSILSLGRFIGSFPEGNDDLIPTYIDIISGMLSDEYYYDSDDEASDDDSMDVDQGQKKRKLKEINGSSRENVEREESRLELLSNVRGTISINESINHFYTPELLDCLIDSVSKIIKTEYVVISWRSKIGVCESLVLVFDKLAKLSYEGGERTVHKKIGDVWQLVCSTCCGSDGDYKSIIQNVLIQFIRFTKSTVCLLKKLNPSDIQLVDSMMEVIKEIQVAKISPVINTEIDNNFQN